MDNLEEITKYDFESAWNNHLEQLYTGQQKSTLKLNDAIKQYNEYVMTQVECVIKYFKDDKGSVLYTVKPRETIGFKEEELR